VKKIHPLNNEITLKYNKITKTCAINLLSFGQEMFFCHCSPQRRFGKR